MIQEGGGNLGEGVVCVSVVWDGPRRLSKYLGLKYVIEDFDGT